MLICVSLNPAIDKRLRLKELRLGAVNRAVLVQPMAGGKAAHVALAARALSPAWEIVWLGFLGGATGDFIAADLVAAGVQVHSVTTRQATRENLEIIDEQGNITEILEPGTEISAAELAAFYDAARKLFAADGPKIIVLSGSLPPGVPPEGYAELIKLARQVSDCQIILDTSGAALKYGLAAAPDLVKPNREEAQMMSGIEVMDTASALAAARASIAQGARGVAVSLGAEGLVYVPADGATACRTVAPRVAVVSTVGCGDASAAGWAWALWRKLPAADAAQLATACGTANCLAITPGRIDADKVRELRQIIELQEQN